MQAAKSDVNVVWKVITAVENDEHSGSAKQEETRRLETYADLVNQYDQFGVQLTELMGREESREAGGEVCKNHTICCGVSGDRYSPRWADVK